MMTESYKVYEGKAALKASLDNKGISRAKYNKLSEVLEKEHLDTMSQCTNAVVQAECEFAGKAAITRYKIIVTIKKK